MDIFGNKSSMKKIYRIFVGWLLISAGVIGLVFPIMPGWLLIVPGVMMLAGDVPLFARIICRVENRFPRVRRFISRMHHRVNGQTPKPPCPP